MNNMQLSNSDLPQKLVYTAFAGFALLALMLLSRYHFLLFHSIAELFSITIVWTLFLIVWNTREQIENKAFVFLGIAYFFVGTVDFFHTISYKGMGLLAPEWGANPATQLWIAARYLESVSLCLFLLLSSQRLRSLIIVAVYLVLTALILLSIFSWNIFPDCYLEGVGLTVFKKTSEYLICLILLAALFLLYHRKTHLEPFVYRLLFASIGLTILGELAFTFYISVYGLSNIIGHFFKIASFFLIYVALVRSSLKQPFLTVYRELKTSEDRYKSLFQGLISAAALHEVLCDAQGNPVDYRFLEVNEAFETMTGLNAADIVGKRVCEVLPEIETMWIQRFGRVALSGQADNFESFSRQFNKYFEVKAYSPESGQFVAVFNDVTEKKHAEEEKDALIKSLQTALQEVKTLKGLIPICANCKQIRDDQGFWNQMESYIRQHSEAEFSHGICPECMAKLYPGLEDE